MFFAKALVALAFATTVAVATPVARQDTNSTTCYFIMTPTPDLGPYALQSDIDYAVGHTVGEQYPDTLFTDNNAPLVRHNDGTYDVESVISVEGQTPANVATFVDSWARTTIDGLAATWLVDAADCVLN